MSRMQENILCYGDNLEILRRSVPGESVDIVYLDPPFATNRSHYFTFRGSAGGEVKTGAVAFKDNWEYNDEAYQAFGRLTGSTSPVSGVLRGLLEILGPCGTIAYLLNVTERLAELHRVLKSSGSLFLHCDRRTSHYLRIICDALFGKSNFRNEIIWHYTGGGRAKNHFSRKHDIILFYTKSQDYTFNIDTVRLPYKETSGYAKSGITSAAGKKYLPHPDGTPADDVWNIPMVNPMAKERTGYPTQKPLALLERIVAACSNKGEVVLDPYCGCGTTLVASQKLGRRWLGIDSSELAVTSAKYRLEREFPGLPFKVEGLSLDLRQAIDLLEEAEPEGSLEDSDADKQVSNSYATEMFEGG